MDELLKAISQNPELIDSYTAEQVDEARTALRDFTAAVKAGEIEADSEALSEAKALSEKLTERSVAIDAEVEARQAEIAALEEALGITDEEEAEVEEPETEVVETPEAEVAEEVVEEEAELVTASAKPTVGKLAAKIPAERKPRVETGPSLVASAGGYEGREVLTAAAYGEMVLKKWKGMSNTAQRTPFSMAQIEMSHKYSVKPGDNDGNARALAAVAQEAAEFDTLTASGGFCAPAEQLYGFFNIATRAGILNLPTVNAPRGAISLPISPSIADFLGQSGIATEWTNDNDIDPGTPATKPVYTFVCPEFQECEVAAYPTILQFGNFAARFYPEAITNATGLALIAADRTVNAARLTYLRTASVPGAVSLTNGGGLVSVSQNLAANAADYRARYGMSETAPLEVVAPTWVIDALWADAIARDSTVDYGDLRRRISAMFGELNLRVSFVYDFDDLASGLFANTADFLMYAPGTVVELDGGTLDLGVVRDSVLNATNDFQTFVEPFVGWCQPGHEVLLLDNVPVCPSGGTGDRVVIECPPSSASA